MVQSIRDETSCRGCGCGCHRAHVRRGRFAACERKGGAPVGQKGLFEALLDDLSGASWTPDSSGRRARASWPNDRGRYVARQAQGGRQGVARCVCSAASKQIADVLDRMGIRVMSGQPALAPLRGPEPRGSRALSSRTSLRPQRRLMCWLGGFACALRPPRSGGVHECKGRFRISRCVSEFVILVGSRRGIHAKIHSAR